MRTNFLSQVSSFCLLGMLALQLEGCGDSPVLIQDVVSYNRAVSRSTNEMLLANVIRSSKREPTYYTRLEGNTESIGLSSPNSLTLPINRSRSASAPIYPSAPYAGSSSTIAALSASLGLTPSDSSTITLQTLDDQKYQFGMQTALGVSDVELYWAEGLQKDLLLFLFVNSVDIPQPVLRQIQARLAGSCNSDHDRSPSQRMHCGVFQQDLTAYNSAANLAEGTTFSAVCAPGPGDAVFVNDPATKVTGDGLRQNFCFGELVHALLALGLDTDDSKKSSAVEKDVPEGVANAPKVRTEAIKEGLTFALQPGPTKLYSICKPQSGGAIFTLPGDTYKSLVKAVLADEKTGTDDEVFPDKSDPCDAGQRVEPGKNDENGKSTKVYISSTADIKNLKIEFALRSFEGVVYYLGQNVRAENESGYPTFVMDREAAWDAKSSTLKNAFREPLFVALHSPSGGALVEATDDDGDTYGIPAPCNDLSLKGWSGLGSFLVRPKPDCSNETPQHESFEILTLVNQMWGLNKQATSSPSNPAIVVGTP